MNYTLLFKNLRESKNLTHDALAKLAGCHRNTVINVESGRPVKFKTIAELMEKMGYNLHSPETKSMALLWLEGISGINLTQEQSATEAHERIAQYRATEKEAVELLSETIMREHLNVRQIHALYYAARNPEIVSILENIHKLGKGEAAHGMVAPGGGWAQARTAGTRSHLNGVPVARHSTDQDRVRKTQGMYGLSNAH